MPPKPTPSSGAAGGAPPKPQVISAAVKAAAAASSAIGSSGAASGGSVSINSKGPTAKQPPKKKKTAVKAKRPGGGGAVVIGKDDTLHPSKLGVMKNRPGGAATSAADKLQFSSQIIKKKSAAATSSSGSTVSVVGGGAKGASAAPAAAAQQLSQFKLERAQIAKRELAEMDAIERAFREDANVWAGPKNVVFPKRYHAQEDEGAEAAADAGGGKKKDTETEKRSPIDNPYVTFHGSQSRGWMYGEGYAGIGGRSWMEATSAAGEEEKKVDSATAPDENLSKSFLVDDVTIIENALRANGLTRHDLTPTAYACLLEQARRYALELLADAQDYAVHAHRHAVPNLLPADLLLAAEMREDGGGGGAPSTLPSPEMVADLASEVNRAPLPPVPADCYNGVALPPAEHQLTARTYDVVNGARTTQKMIRGGDLPLTPAEMGSGLGGKKAEGTKRGRENSFSPSKKKKLGAYGAGKGRQIVVNIKGSKSSGPSSQVATATGRTMTSKSGQTGPKRKLTKL